MFYLGLWASKALWGVGSSCHVSVLKIDPPGTFKRGPICSPCICAPDSSCLKRSPEAGNIRLGRLIGFRGFGFRGLGCRVWGGLRCICSGFRVWGTLQSQNIPPETLQKAHIKTCFYQEGGANILGCVCIYRYICKDCGELWDSYSGLRRAPRQKLSYMHIYI